MAPAPPASHPATLARLPALLGAALAVLLLAQTGDIPAPGQGASTLFLPASGVALALLLRGGPGLLPGLGAGWLLAYALAGQDPLQALAYTLGDLAAVGLAAHWLRTRSPFAPDTPHFGALHHLLLGACGAAALAGAALTSLLHVLLDLPTPQGRLYDLLQNWMGQALGFLLVTPLVLSCRRILLKPLALVRVKEGLAAWALAIPVGIVIFGPAPAQWLAPLANAYWMFLFVSWSGMRLGLAPTIALLNLIALLALWGSYQGTGYFGRDIAATWGFGYWSYTMILGVTGLALASYMAEQHSQRVQLRIAATAFDSQEGLLITDAQGKILRANPALLRLTGLALADVLGQTALRLLAPPKQPEHPGPDFTPAQDAQHRLRLRRSNGADIPVWVRISAVRASHGPISHYVVMFTDLTDQKAQEERRRAAELAQRNALVREVHHHIKNHLQGIIGMLRQLDRQHPQLHTAINQMASQVHNIAVVHGLQGRSPGEAILLAELTGALTQGMGQHWGTPIETQPIDLLPRWHVAAGEAVPVALVLGELLVNALKHGGMAARDVRIGCDSDAAAGWVRITLSNPCQAAPPDQDATLPAGHGLNLVRLLLPRHGARLSHRRQDGRMWAKLELGPPVIHRDNQPHEK